MNIIIIDLGDDRPRCIIYKLSHKDAMYMYIIFSLKLPKETVVSGAIIPLFDAVLDDLLYSWLYIALSK